MTARSCIRFRESQLGRSSNEVRFENWVAFTPATLRTAFDTDLLLDSVMEVEVIR